VHPDKAGGEASPLGWHQHVDDINRLTAPDAVVHQGEQLPTADHGGLLRQELTQAADR